MAGGNLFGRVVGYLVNEILIEGLANKYYTGYPKDLGPSRIIPFTSERQFVQLLHEGRPVVVTFTIKCTYTKHLDKVLEEAAVEFYPHIKFVRVECPKYPGFCITRQRNDYPFIEVFHSPEQATNQGKAVDPNMTKYSVKVLPFNFDQSVYGFREYFKKHGLKFSETNLVQFPAFIFNASPICRFTSKMRCMKHRLLGSSALLNGRRTIERCNHNVYCCHGRLQIPIPSNGRQSLEIRESDLHLHSSTFVPTKKNC